MKHKAVVRVDDVGMSRDHGKDERLELFRKFNAVMKELNIPYCACCIPKLFDLEMLKLMKQETELFDGLSIGLHGWDHSNRLDASKRSSEFGGLDRQEKRDRISLGVKWMSSLERLEPIAFSAPFNRYDGDVVEACKDVGLKVFFGGYGREMSDDYGMVGRDMYFLPATKELYVADSVKSKNDILDVCERGEIKRLNFWPYVMTLHVTWEHDNLNGALKGFLEGIKKYFTFADVRGL